MECKRTKQERCLSKPDLAPFFILRKSGRKMSHLSPPECLFLWRYRAAAISHECKPRCIVEGYRSYASLEYDDDDEQNMPGIE